MGKSTSQLSSSGGIQNNTLHRGQNNINLDAHGHLGWHRAESHYTLHYKLNFLNERLHK